MELTSNYPVRAFIRHKAKMQLVESMGMDICPFLDDELLRELATTLLQSERGQVAFQPYSSREAASAVEDNLAAEIAETYQTIQQRQHDPIVQSLNALL